MTDTPPRRNVARTVAIVVMIGAVMIGLAVVALGQRRARSSDVVVEAWDVLDGAHWLKANLSGARVTVPDRPHARHEFSGDWSGFSTDVERTRTFTVRTNAERLRGGPLGPKAGLRIIALGDSVTHGWGVDEADAYPARLQVHLTAGGHPAEVLNAGVPANRVSGMARWCETQAPALAPDWIIWTRRPGFDDPPPYNQYVDAVERCARATGARMLVVLPPISAFDLHGGAVWEREQQGLWRRLRPKGVSVVELTPVFRAAAQGQGEALVVDGQTLQVVDQASDRIWLAVPLEGEQLPQAVYDLFEAEPDVREALMYDDGHPDQPGYDLFARTVASELITLLRQGERGIRGPATGPQGPPLRTDEP